MTPALHTSLLRMVRLQAARRPSLTLFAANMTRAGLGFLLGLLVARSLGPAEFGLFTTFIVVTIWAHNLIGEGFDPGVVRFYARSRAQDSAGAPAVLGSAIAIRALLVLPMLWICWGAAAWSTDAQMSAVLRLASATALAASFCTLALAVLQARERFVAYALLTPLVNALRIAVVPLLWILGAFTLASLMWTHALFFALVAVIGLALLRDDLRGLRFDIVALRELFRFSKWTALANLSFLLQAHLAIPVLAHVKGAAEAGLYSAAATLLLFIDQLTVSLLTVKLPFTSRFETPAELRRFVRALAPRLLAVALGLCLLVPLSGPIVAMVFGAAYVDSAAVMRVLLPGFIATLVSHPLYLVLYSLDRPHWYAATGAVALASWCGLAFWLVPAHGVLGAAWATTGSRVLQAALIVALVFHAMRRGHPGAGAPANPSTTDPGPAPVPAERLATR